MNKQGSLPVISLFSGVMGLEPGLEQAGFEIGVAIECNPSVVKTIRKNRPDLAVTDREIEKVTTDEILREAKLRGANVPLSLADHHVSALVRLEATIQSKRSSI